MHPSTSQAVPSARVQQRDIRQIFGITHLGNRFGPGVNLPCIFTGLFPGVQVPDQVRLAQGGICQKLTDTATNGELDEDVRLGRTMRPQVKPISAAPLYPSSCD